MKMSKECLEALGENIRYKKEYIGNDTYRLYIKKNEIELLENYLTELEQIKNSNPSEALERTSSEIIDGYPTGNVNVGMTWEEHSAIKQTLQKAQEQEKENELLKEIIKSFFVRGCPLHQYIDKDFGLTIEVDNECSIMHLGKYKGIDLNKKLQEVLKEVE